MQLHPSDIRGWSMPFFNTESGELCAKIEIESLDYAYRKVGPFKTRLYPKLNLSAGSVEVFLERVDRDVWHKGLKALRGLLASETIVFEDFELVLHSASKAVTRAEVESVKLSEELEPKLLIKSRSDGEVLEFFFDPDSSELTFNPVP